MFRKLKDHNGCTNFTLDLLVTIKTQLLLVDPNRRAVCGDIVKRFRDINDRVRGDSTYSTEKAKSLDGKLMSGSAELVDMSFSPEMTDEYINRLDDKFRTLPGLHPADIERETYSTWHLWKGSAWGVLLLVGLYAYVHFI
jgi:hypothetical protein